MKQEASLISHCTQNKDYSYRLHIFYHELGNVSRKKIQFLTRDHKNVDISNAFCKIKKRDEEIETSVSGK